MEIAMYGPPDSALSLILAGVVQLADKEEIPRAQLLRSIIEQLVFDADQVEEREMRAAIDTWLLNNSQEVPHAVG
jgi:hypothetical protein